MYKITPSLILFLFIFLDAATAMEPDLEPAINYKNKSHKTFSDIGLLYGKPGSSADSNSVDFDKKEIFYRRNLTTTNRIFGASYPVTVNMEGLIGELDAPEKTATMAGIGLGLAIRPTNNLYFNIGAQLLYLSETKFQTENENMVKDFGGPRQFGLYLGADYLIVPELFVGYRWQHMSNANTYLKNSGLDTNNLYIGYRFN